MENSSVESSASHFGVKLRKVGTNGSDEKLNTAGRKSLPPSVGVPSNCESRAALRKSATSAAVSKISSDCKSNSLPAAVLSRQEKAEKQAIERRKKLSNGHSPSSSSNSWEKKSTAKPAIAPKPVVPRAGLSRSKSSAAATGLTRRSVTPKSSPLVESKGFINTSSKVSTRRNKDNKTSKLASIDSSVTEVEIQSSLLAALYNQYEQYQPTLQALYSQVRVALSERGKLLSILMQAFHCML